MTLAGGHAAPRPHREGVYEALERRNAVVGLLRLVVPLGGLLTFVVLVAQIVVSTLTGGFSIGSLSVAPDSVTIAAPEYAGVLGDGSRYRVWAEEARNAFAEPDFIDLRDGALFVERPNGTSLDVSAPVARLETVNEIVIIEGIAYFEDSTGTRGTLERSRFDWASEVLVSDGPVEIDYADGTRILADGLHYDLRSGDYRFTGARVTIPQAPRARSQTTSTESIGP